MDPRKQRPTTNESGDPLVSTHGCAKEAEPSDPLDLVGTRVPGGDLAFLARCFIEEYAAMGYGSDQILEMFRQPQYVAIHPVYRSQGEEAVRGLIREVLADCGVLQVSGLIREEPPEPRSDLVQIELPRPDSEDNPS